jgi:hypothetical protein
MCAKNTAASSACPAGSPASRSSGTAIYSDEGIVGQARRDRLIRLDDVPVDYFKVSSGLGEGRRAA